MIKQIKKLKNSSPSKFLKFTISHKFLQKVCQLKFVFQFFIFIMTQASAPQFVVTKWNAVALWSWEMEQDTCAICKYFFIF